MGILSVMGVVFLLCPECIGPTTMLKDDGVDPSRSQIADLDGLAHHVAPDGQPACTVNYYQRTADLGVSWSAPVRVDADPSFSACSVPERVWLGSDGVERVYVAFVSRPGGSGRPTIVVAVSPDRGASWPASLVSVSPVLEPGGFVNASLYAAPGRRAWLLWIDGPSSTDSHLYASRSQDGGVSWSPAARIDVGLTTVARSLMFGPGPGGSLVALLGTTDGAEPNRLYFLRSDDDGGTWTLPSRIDDLAAPVALAGQQFLSIPDGRLLVTWGDRRGGAADLWSRVSLDAGRTWEPVQRVDTGDPVGAANSGILQIARTGPGHEVVAAWLESRDSLLRVFLNRSADGGLTWGVPAGSDSFPVSVSSADARIWSVSLMGHSSGRALVAWADSGFEALARCGNPICPAAYVSQSCDGGLTWEPWQRLQTGLCGPNDVRWLPLPGGAAVLTETCSAEGAHFMRFDGPALALPRGPTTYCLGSDPPVDSLAVSAGCPGPLWLQWYVNGVAVPGANAPSYQPSLPEGDHDLEVRASCFADPGCVIDSIATTLRVRAPEAPPDVGNHLLAVRRGAEAALDWSNAPSAPDAHAHLRRADGVGLPWTMVAPDPLQARSWVDAPPAGPTLHLYDARQADVCEAETAN